MRRQSGFTMLELIVVIAIIAIAAAVAIPSYLSWLPDIRLRSAVRSLKSDLGLAKQRAVRENGRVTVLFDIPNNQYTVFVDNGENPGAGGIADDWIPNGDEDVMKTVSIPVDVTMYAASFDLGLPRVRFDGRGLPNNAGGTVRMNNTKNNYRGITMSLVGLITIERSTDAGGSWQDVE